MIEIEKKKNLLFHEYNIKKRKKKRLRSCLKKIILVDIKIELSLELNNKKNLNV